MAKYKFGKDFDYIQGYLTTGHAEVEVEADDLTEAKKLAEEAFYKGDYSVVVDDFDIDDCGELSEETYPIN